MSLTDDHFARKIAAQSKAWEDTSDAPKKERKREPAEPKMGICDKCKKEALLRPYRFKETSVSNGAASFGTVTKHLCEDCAPKSRAQKDAEVPQLDKKQLKNLMRSARKALREQDRKNLRPSISAVFFIV